MRPRLRSLIAAVVALTVGLAAALVGVQVATAAAGEYLDWGVKQSFRQYVAGPIASGSITLGGGVTANADGSYRWPASSSSYDPATGVASVQSTGSVAFAGHAGALALTISDLSLRIDPAGTTQLSAAVVSKNSGGQVIDYGVVAVADVTVATGALVVGDGVADALALPAVLATAAAPAFAGFYSAGDALDPVGLHIVGSWPAESGGDPTPAPSDTATPTPEPTPSETAITDIPTGGGTFDGVTLEWTGNAEMQSVPPAGGSNYFSAGVSNGTQGDYRASEGNVSIVQRSATGAEGAATWATRAAYLGGGTQLVRVGGGRAVVAADGSGTVSFTGAFSVNFYGGLIPFTIADPVLTIAANGTGTLIADVSGYAGDMADTTKKTPLAPVSDVVVATFANVAIDTKKGFIVAPNYAGVAVTVPSAATPQNRTAAGWGAWPQSWVDFQVATGLSSYWYSSGGSADARKAPSSFAVGFAGATVPQVPVAVPAVVPATADDAADDAKAETAKPTKVGSLTWGVKSSFRSYITGTIAKGAISLSGGAKSASGVYRFGQAKGGSYTVKKATGTSQYAGSVRFTGHAGLLDLTFSDPVVRITSASTATLSGSVNGGPPVAMGSIDLAAAKKTTSGGSVAYASAPVSLTPAGAAVFSYNGSGFYAVGEAMDPVSFVIGSAAKKSTATTTVAAFTADDWTAPATPPAATGAALVAPAEVLRAGDQVTATAGGFAANERDVKVVVYSSPVVLEKSLTANAAGVVEWTGILPLSLEPGEHTLTFQGSVDRGVVLTVAESEALAGCMVTDAAITWGFKESFRSYISGSIANGEWTASDGATYATPSFGWNSGTGGFDPDTSSGLVTFAGSVRFTGHEGLLDTTIANPQLLFVDKTTAYLLLDVSGVTMDDALAGKDDSTSDRAVSFVELDLAAGDVEVTGSTITATDVPTAITDEGYATFPNYEPGTAFDPISFELTTAADCAVAAAPVTEATAAPAALEPVAAAGPGWLVWVTAALFVLLLAAVAVIVVLLRRRSQRID